MCPQGNDHAGPAREFVAREIAFVRRYPPVALIYMLWLFAVVDIVRGWFA